MRKKIADNWLFMLGGCMILLALFFWLISIRTRPVKSVKLPTKLETRVSKNKTNSETRQDKLRQNVQRWQAWRKEQFRQRQEVRSRLYRHRSIAKRVDSHEYQINWFFVDRRALYSDVKVLADAVRKLYEKQRMKIPKELSAILARY